MDYEQILRFVFPRIFFILIVTATPRHPCFSPLFKQRSAFSSTPLG
jgi:hypothetical protein